MFVHAALYANIGAKRVAGSLWDSLMKYTHKMRADNEKDRLKNTGPMVQSGNQLSYVKR